MEIIQRVRPTSRYDIYRRMTRLQHDIAQQKHKIRAAIVDMDLWQHGQLLDAIHWRDKALCRAEEAAAYLPTVAMLAFSGFALAVVAVVLALS